MDKTEAIVDELIKDFNEVYSGDTNPINQMVARLLWMHGMATCMAMLNAHGRNDIIKAMKSGRF